MSRGQYHGLAREDGCTRQQYVQRRFLRESPPLFGRMYLLGESEFIIKIHLKSPLKIIEFRRMYLGEYCALGGGNSKMTFFFNPILGQIIQFDEHIFQIEVETIYLPFYLSVPVIYDFLRPGTRKRRTSSSPPWKPSENEHKMWFFPGLPPPLE